MLIITIIIMTAIVTITRSTGTLHTSAKGRLTSVAIRIVIWIRDSNRHRNLIVCSLTHCQPSMKISCKSVRKFLQPVANRQTTTITYPPWRRNQQWLVRYTVAMIEWGTFKVNCSSIQHEYIASCLSIKPPDLSASVMRGLTYQCERVSSYFHDWRIATRLIP